MSARYFHTKMENGLLYAIAVIPLNQHHLLCYIKAFFDSAKSNHIAEAWISFLASMRHTHPSSDTDIESGHNFELNKNES
jgi:hypothetical protein